MHKLIMLQQNVQPCKTGIWSSIFTSGKQIWRPSAQNVDTTRQPKVFALKYVQFHLKPFESCSAQSLTCKGSLDLNIENEMEGITIEPVMYK